MTFGALLIAAHQSRPDPKQSKLPTTILVAEDEFIIRLTIAEFLRDEGYEVSQVELA